MRIEKKQLTFLLLIALFAASAFAGAPGASAKNFCSVSKIPAEARRLLRRRAGGWILQDAGRLNASARKRWAAEKPVSCPGFAIGRFESAASVSYGVLLVPRKTSARGYRIVVLTRLNGRYQLKEAEASNSADSANFFIRGIPISRFFDLRAKRKFNISVADGIVLVDAGRGEYESDLFFWSGDAYHSQPVHY